MMRQHLSERLEFDSITQEYEREQADEKYANEREGEEITTGTSTTGRTFKRRLSGQAASAAFDFQVMPYPNRGEVNAN